MTNKRVELYSAVCMAVLNYGDYVKDSYEKLNRENIDDAAKGILAKYQETMNIINEYVDYRLKEQANDN